jgi:hypothetical protein
MASLKRNHAEKPRLPMRAARRAGLPTRFHVGRGKREMGKMETSSIKAMARFTKPR